MKVAFVTSGDRGIGYATCEALARQNMKVIMGTKDLSYGEAEAKKLRFKGLDVKAQEIDVSKIDSIEKAVSSIRQSFQMIDILINNSGLFSRGNLFEVSNETITKDLQNNLFGPIHTIRAFTDLMIENGYGRIVNVSSSWGSFGEGMKGPSIYSISKAAVNAATVVGARALPEFIKMNAMCPGWAHRGSGLVDVAYEIEDGTDTIVWLATLPKEGPSGKFFRHREEIPW